MVTWRHVVGGVFGAVVSTCWISWILLHSYYVETRPRAPALVEGRIHPLHQHGTVVYLTSSERNLRDCLFWSGMGLTLVGFVCNLRFEFFRSSPPGDDPEEPIVRRLRAPERGDDGVRR